MIDTNKAIRKLLDANYSVSVQFHAKPGGDPRYTVVVRHMGTDKRAQGWGSTAAEAIEDLRYRAGMQRDDGE